MTLAVAQPTPLATAWVVLLTESQRNLRRVRVTTTSGEHHLGGVDTIIGTDVVVLSEPSANGVGPRHSVSIEHIESIVVLQH